jgi:hypothetical protein
MSPKRNVAEMIRALLWTISGFVDYLVPLLRKRQQVSDILEENLSYGKL